MDPMERLCTATIDQLKEFYSQHGIRSDIPGFDAFDCGIEIVAMPRKDRVFSVRSKAHQWPLLLVVSWNIDLDDFILPDPEAKRDTVDITNGFEEILDLYRAEL